jgi:predicted DCC family thiol-disulfide oxidoreductase YuxK
VNTELPETINAPALFYDAHCRFCRALALRTRAALTRKNIALAPLQSPAATRTLHAPTGLTFDEIKFLDPDGRIFGGARALVEVSRRFPWTWPIRQLARIPWIFGAMDAAYRWVARHRGCTASACAAPRHSGGQPPVRWISALPTVALVTAVLVLGTGLAPWVFMWALAFALFAGCKWLTYQQALAESTAGRERRAGYLFLWPGMNPEAFADRRPAPGRPRVADWVWAVSKMLFGIGLTWAIARRVPDGDSLLAGWIGMAGIVLMLHFGAFHLLALGWQTAGVAVQPIMRSPLLSTSLREFWAIRWNNAFHELAFRFVYRPARRIVGTTFAPLGVFIASGLIHELVITIPARGGYGLPTTYFAIQGIAFLFERSKLGRRLRLGHGLVGRSYALAAAALPAPLLFPAPFIRHVILPMLQDWHALPL